MLVTVAGLFIDSFTVGFVVRKLVYRNMDGWTWATLLGLGAAPWTTGIAQKQDTL